MMITRTFVALLFSAALLAAQGQQGLVSVPLKIGDLEYSVTLQPTAEGVAEMSRRFCAERASEFLDDVSADGGLESVCVVPVYNYLENAVMAMKRPDAPPTLKVPVSIGGTQYEITFPRSDIGAMRMASEFCLKEGTKIGITADTFYDRCLLPLGDYLKTAVRKEAEGQVIAVTMRVQGKTFEFKWDSRRQDATSMARMFCDQNGKSLGIAPQDTLSKCVAPVANYLTNNSQQPAKPSQPVTTTATLTIGGQTFKFEFEATEASVRATAAKFCTEYGARLGIPEEDLGIKCVNIIATALVGAVRGEQ